MWSEYTFLFFERSAVLLVAVFAFTRLPGLRRRFGTGPAAGLWNLAVFAVIAVAGTLLGVDFIPGQVNPVPWRWHPAGAPCGSGPSSSPSSSLDWRAVPPWAPGSAR
ncbi:hypothetical protein [Alicyclobacillus macrosporangiidus]|uniref:hypothetical protein n=1 Tax=Alicyclobacillus macrosporangiidus TaxID=392015 RepID=UPI0004950533|nr:hypothetical protein [Alicyclobacillus macrosporangiidus]